VRRQHPAARRNERQSAGWLPDCPFHGVGDRCGLFLRTLAGLNAINVGFRTEHLLLAEINPRQRYPAGKDIALHQSSSSHGAMAGVDSVSPATVAYLADDMTGRTSYRKARDTMPRNIRKKISTCRKSLFRDAWNSYCCRARLWGSGHSEFAESGLINQSSRGPGIPAKPVGKRFKTDEHDSDGFAGKRWMTGFRSSECAATRATRVCATSLRTVHFALRTAA